MFFCSLCSLSYEHSHMQMSTLPNYSSDHDIKRNELSETSSAKRSNIKIFSSYNHIFLIPFHIVLEPSPFSLPHTYPWTPVVRKTNYPLGCSFSCAFCTIINLRLRERRRLEKREIIHQGLSVAGLKRCGGW